METTKMEPKQDKEKAEAFLKEYEELCKKHGLNLTITPAYKVSQDTGTWSTVLQVSVNKLPKQE